MEIASPSSSETIYRISPQSLGNYCYFSSLSLGALEALSQKLHVVESPRGSVIIREGDAGDSFYFISNGEVEVLKKTEKGLTARLSVLGDGEVFGEMALLTCSPRCTTVIAKTDVTLLRLGKSDFEKVVLMDSSVSHMIDEKTKTYRQFNQIKTLEPFALLQPDQTAILLNRLEERAFTPGEKIITQGEEGDSYYIIRSGSVAVLKQMLSDEAEKVAVLGPGDGFGEEALLTGQRRSATVQAIDETVVWILSRADFESVMKQTFLEEISSDNVPFNKIGKYAFLDVRTRMEFGEERIRGAINIPLDELRHKYSSLDRSRKYYVYCLGGSRSAIAAFLLKMNGYMAQSVKGGLNTWPHPLLHGSDGIHRPSKPT